MLRSISIFGSIHALMLGALPALFALGCGGGGPTAPICGADPSPSPSSVLLDLSLDTTAGDTPFALGAPLTSNVGVHYSVSKLRFFISHVGLVDSAGGITRAPLADASGHPLEYGVALVDYAKPETQVLHVLAAPGNYAALSISIGVPSTCSDGGALNHEDASEKNSPLDVDSDMYWGWSSGYVFLKIEGHARSPEGNQSFVFHLGDDKQYVTTTVPASLRVTTPAAHRLAVDVNRLFTTPSGRALPDMTGVASENVSHGGAEADTIANNCARSGVIGWIQ